MSPTVQVSVYTQLHETNIHPLFRSLSTHSFMKRSVTHCSGLCLHTASWNELSPTVQVSVYTQLLVTNFHLLFRSLSTHNFMKRTVTHCSGLCLHTASCNQLSPTVQVPLYTQLLLTLAYYRHNKPIYNLLLTSTSKQCDLKLYLLSLVELPHIYTV